MMQRKWVILDIQPYESNTFVPKYRCRIHTTHLLFFNSFLHRCVLLFCSELFIAVLILLSKYSGEGSSLLRALHFKTLRMFADPMTLSKTSTFPGALLCK